jgi:hypothetical protein
MKKNTFKDDLLRIHELTYGKEILNEQSFLSKLFGGGDKKPEQTSKIDEPKKADLVSSDVSDFYKNIEETINSGGLSQQQSGSISFQKGVESMQIGLMLLGYELPKYGVDGLFGSETAIAVAKFIGDKLKTQSKTDSKIVTATPEMLTTLLGLLKERKVTSEDLKKYIDASVTTGGGANFTDLDLTTDEGYGAYAQICQKFIENRPPNLLGITGTMMADGAKKAFGNHRKYVPPELALAQLAAEGGIGNKDPQSRPIRTRNPFNVGNVDSGANVQHGDVQSGINTYYNLIAKDYLVKGKTASDLVKSFVNKNGSRYATAAYEPVISKIAGEANRIAAPIYASLSKKPSTDTSSLA